MFSLRTLCWSLKSLTFKAHCYKVARKFCSRQSDHFKEVVQSSTLQRYFDHLETKGVDGSYSSGIQSLIKQLIIERRELLKNIQDLVDLEKSSEGENDMLQMLKEEKKELKSQLSDIEFKLLDASVPELPNFNEVILEINSGVGGKEAMLFANDLQEMYLSYVAYKNWNITYLDSVNDDLGGLRHCTAFVEGLNVMNYLSHESGIHRVQRVPVTEKHGRIHTSTVTVAIFPRPQDIDVNLKEKDLHIETMRSSGAGGQHVNKTESAVRITHLPTGITTECQTDRSQIKNKEIARQKLCAKLYEIQQREQITSMKQSRKSQIGTSARSDKIRTYNYPQGRITDHRINKTIHNLPGFLEGGEYLDALINELILSSERERLCLFLTSLEKEFLSVT